MTHRFPLKEIAQQSGLSTATIDRVLNDRAHVSPQAKARVSAAIAELERQEQQLSARGRRMFFDFVVEAPSRFSREVRRAAETVLPQIGQAVCRPRFVFQERMADHEVVATLTRIRKRGSQGVCLKARDTPQIRTAVDALAAAGIPVVTLVTDMRDTQRIAYVGLDNVGAGRTAAYLMSHSLGCTTGVVLAMRSNAGFLGEVDRATAFEDALHRRCPKVTVVSLSGGGGTTGKTERLLDDHVDVLTELRGVYSMGGGNRAIGAVLQRHRLRPDIFVAHDLDAENRALISDGQIDYVLHHDLKQDLRSVFDAFLSHHGLIHRPTTPKMSEVQVITPENVPRSSLSE